MKRVHVLASMAALGVSGAARSAGAQSLPLVRTAATAVDQSGALFYAHDLGLFTKHGLDVSIFTTNDNQLAVSSVVGNSIDIAYNNIVVLEQAFRKGIPIVIVAPAAVNDDRWPSNYLVVPKGSPIKTALDLQGKTLGTAQLKSLGDFATEAWVKSHGGDPGTLKWAEIPYIELGAAMQAGRIDAAFTLEPYATQIRSTTQLLGRPYEAIAKRFLGAAYFATRQWASDHPDLVARFAAAIREASEWGNANHAKSALVLEKYAKVDPATLAQMTRSVYAEALVPEEIQPTIDFGAKAHFIDASFPAADMIFKARA
jgi:NitT/TauT family transport system substrate-binding protein